MKPQRTVISLFTAAVLLLLLNMQSAFAAMTIAGTRIIFPGAEREQTVRTTNKGNMPVLVQVWVDDGGKTDDINKIKVPFTATPPVYRVDPGKGQSVRLIYNGMSLPQDRESVFWFNLLEIPPVTSAEKAQQRLELAFRTRIKIFYRPNALKKSSGVQEAEHMKWEPLNSTRGVKITNTTPYYLSLDSAYILSAGTKYPLSVDMVPPFTTKEFPLENKGRVPASFGSATVNMINDYGSVVSYQLTPAAGGGLTIKNISNK